MPCQNKKLAIGIMSGTSMDGVDVALVELTDESLDCKGQGRDNPDSYDQSSENQRYKYTKCESSERVDIWHEGTECVDSERENSAIEQGSSRVRAELHEPEKYQQCAKVRLIDFETYPYPVTVRERLLELAGGAGSSTKELCLMQELLGKLYARACLELCKKAGVKASDIAFAGCHGQTLWHQPTATEYLGESVRGSLQLGDPSFINEALGCPVVSDFRLRDMAAGGQGAPIVPYTEFLMYRGDEAVALLNIGGIANITVLPANCELSDVLAFDTVPGNALIDKLVSNYSDGMLDYDAGGKIALSGSCNEALLRFMIGRDDFLSGKPPKSTGREHYNLDYLKEIDAFCRNNDISEVDEIATVTRFTAECVYRSIVDFSTCMPKRLIVSGGGAHNEAILGHLRALFTECEVITATEAGINPDAKEAVAMAVLAGETLKGRCNNVPSVTGAGHPVVMGRISGIHFIEKD